jgi:long-chain acyl-CoA synthetase
VTPSTVRVVADDAPLAALDTLDLPGPTAVVDHRRPGTAAAVAALATSTLPPGTWLVAATSGSTGAPRAVCRTRASWQASVDAVATLTGTRRGTRVLVPGPLSSTLFLYAAWHARQVDARPVLAPLAQASSGDVAWDVVHLVPHQLAALLDATTDDAGALDGRTAVVAGAALADRLRARAQRHGLRVVEYYGAAELSFVAAGDDGALRLFPDVQAESRDGVLWVRSPYTALGYAPTASAGGPWRVDGQGWATVGDRGSVLPGRRLVVRGRGGAAVQTGGATVHVADVESALRTNDQVRDVIVVALPHARLGQVVAAVVESPDATRDGLRAWARRHLDAPARPRHWAVVAHLPRTGTGKPDRGAALRLLPRTWYASPSDVRRHHA